MDEGEALLLEAKALQAQMITTGIFKGRLANDELLEEVRAFLEQEGFVSEPYFDESDNMIALNITGFCTRRRP